MKESDRVEDRLESLTLYVNRIKDVVPKDLNSYTKSEYVVKGAIERNLQLISDAELDLLAHVYRLKGKEPVGDEVNLPAKLEGILSSKVLQDFKRRRDLRNELVHAYKEPELDKKVFAQASDLKDVEEFKVAVEKAIGAT